MIPELSFFLLLVIESCAGVTGDLQSCTGKSINVRVPYETYAQCEAASRNVTVPGGIQPYVRGVCIAIPTTIAQQSRDAALAQAPASRPAPVTSASATLLNPDVQVLH
jgi:hypothetical protein